MPTASPPGRWASPSLHRSEAEAARCLPRGPASVRVWGQLACLLSCLDACVCLGGEGAFSSCPWRISTPSCSANKEGSPHDSHFRGDGVCLCTGRWGRGRGMREGSAEVRVGQGGCTDTAQEQELLCAGLACPSPVPAARGASKKVAVLVRGRSWVLAAGPQDTVLIQLP